MKYRKVIEVTDTGMVFSEVFAKDGRRCGLESWSGIFRSPKMIEKRCRKAHQWADELIEVLKRQETE